MKIAFAVEHFDAARGGAERYVWDFAKWLVAQGHSLDVYTLNAPNEMPGCCIHLLQPKRSARRFRTFRFAEALQKALHDHRYDIVQGFNHVWPADILMLHGGVHPAFEKYNALSSPTAAGRFLKRLVYRFQPKYRLLRANEKMQFSGEDRHFVAVSKRVAQDMMAYYPEVSDRVHVIYPGLDVSRFFVQEDLKGMRSHFRKELGVPEQRSVLLFVSHNYRLKGLYDLIDAMPKILERKPDTELWVAGRGRSSRYHRRACRLGVEEHVRFLGGEQDIRLLYASADALIHPSYYDTFGGVCLEAMACGLPVAVSRNSGVSELLPPEREELLFDMPAAPGVIALAAVHALDVKRDTRQEEDYKRVLQGCLREESFSAVLELYRNRMQHQ